MAIAAQTLSRLNTRGRRLPVIAVCSLWLSACISHQHLAYEGTPANYYAVPASYNDYYAYAAEYPTPETFRLPFRQLEGYYVHGIRFPSSEYNGQRDNLIEARYFRSLKQDGRPKPLLIVLPIWATHTFPSTVMANGYALHSQGDANILWLQGDAPLFDWFVLGSASTEQEFTSELAKASARFRAAVIDIRRLLDWAETRPEIDSSRMGLIGFSMSAVVAANVAGNDSRVQTAVYVMGGALPWDILTECGVPAGFMGKRVTSNLGWSQEHLRDYLREALSFGDPARWKGRYRPDKTLIVEGTKDTCMPAKSRETLWRATGRPERIRLPYNHWQPFLAMTPVGLNLLNNDIFAFLDRELLPAPLQAEQRDSPDTERIEASTGAMQISASSSEARIGLQR
ncbi:MAG: hypothetical protein AAGA91_02745 [Pseudomonadota bacterium]